MRRTIALIALSATSWSHVTAFQCEMGHAPEEQSAPAHHGHTSMDAVPMERSHAQEHDGPKGDECQMVMACGVVSTEPVETVPPQVISIAARNVVHTNDASLGLVRGAVDPPPPRRLV